MRAVAKLTPRTTEKRTSGRVWGPKYHPESWHTVTCAQGCLVSRHTTEWPESLLVEAAAAPRTSKADRASGGQRFPRSSQASLSSPLQTTTSTRKAVASGVSRGHTPQDSACRDAGHWNAHIQNMKFSIFGKIKRGRVW